MILLLLSSISISNAARCAAGELCGCKEGRTNLPDCDCVTYGKDNTCDADLSQKFATTYSVDGVELGEGRVCTATCNEYDIT